MAFAGVVVHTGAIVWRAFGTGGLECHHQRIPIFLLLHVGNFSTKSVSVDAGHSIGQHTPLAKSHLVRELVVPAGNPIEVESARDRPGGPDFVPLHAGRTVATSPESGIRGTVCAIESLARERVRVESEMRMRMKNSMLW